LRAEERAAAAEAEAGALRFALREAASGAWSTKINSALARFASGEGAGAWGGAAAAAAAGGSGRGEGEGVDDVVARSFLGLPLGSFRFPLTARERAAFIVYDRSMQRLAAVALGEGEGAVRGGGTSGASGGSSGSGSSGGSGVAASAPTAALLGSSASAGGGVGAGRAGAGGALNASALWPSARGTGAPLSPPRVVMRPPPGTFVGSGGVARPAFWGDGGAASRGSLAAAAAPTAASAALLAEVAALQQAWARSGAGSL
jgi:hypothetical protein